MHAKRKATMIARGKPASPFCDPAVRAKSKATHQARYGVDNVFSAVATQEKIKATNLKRFGVENPFASESVKVQIRATMVERYGAENPSQVPALRAKIQQVFDERYEGNPQRDPAVREKTRRTNMDRYGGPAPLCDHGIMVKARSKSARSGCRRRPFVFPSGRVVMVQGYEGEAIARLLFFGTPEDDIVVGVDVPKFRYIMPQLWGGHREHTYLPDIYIPSLHKIIEVKSLWTFQGGKCPDGLGIDNEVYERNMMKRMAVGMAGYTHEFMIKEKNGHWVTF